MTREGLVGCQHDLGVFIQKNGLHGGESPLMKHLVESGISHYRKDNIATLIIETFWEHLNR